MLHHCTIGLVIIGLAYQAANLQWAIAYCKLALRLSAFSVYCPPTVRLVRDVRVAGAGVVYHPRWGFVYWQRLG